MRSISSSFKRSHDRHFFPRNTFPVAESTQTFARCANYSIEHKYKNIVIIGGGIAGLSTARYLLARDRNLHVTVIDKNEALSEQSTYSTYDKQQVGLLHYNIPSRRNGNMLCPSLTTPWTTRSLWNEAFIPLMKSYIGTSEKGKPANISFDVPSLIGNRNMWTFAYHFLMQKYIYASPEHACNRSILEYNMKCLYDPSDQLIQRIDYGRCAKGTKLLDGTIVSGDSSGDIGLFCQGLLHELKNEYGDALALQYGEEITSIERDGSFIRSVISVDRDGNKKTIEADATVVACGIGSTHLCNTLDVPCPVFPAKGHLATVASKIQCDYNITLPGGLGYASPMAIKDSEGRHLYRLSGFVHFDLSRETNFDRIEALVDATRLSLPDVELIDASACHRPVSADDRPIVGCADKYSNLYLCSGFGSRGWSVGLGCGKLLSSIILGLNCEIDPAPFNPRRFR